MAAEKTKKSKKVPESQAPATSAKILVTGDYVLDHHIYEGRRHHYGDCRNRGVHEVEELGGAAPIHYLLQELGRGVESHLGVMIDESRKPLLAEDAHLPSSSSAYAMAGKWR